MDGGEARRAERKERRDRERRRKGAEQSDEAFGGDDLAVAEAFAAAKRDDVPDLERAFRLGVPPRVTHSGNKQTLLHAACSRGCLRTAKLVVRKAVYDSNPPFKQFLDARARDGQTALDVATRGGFTSTSEWLTALGAKANVTANLGGGMSNYPGPSSSLGFPTAVCTAPYHQQQFPGYPQAPHGYPYAPMGNYPGPAEFYDPYGGHSVNPAAAVLGQTASTSGPVDSYLFGALEAALGDAADDGGGVQDDLRSDRKRAQALVKKVTELIEDRDDFEADLGEALKRAEQANSINLKLKGMLKQAVIEKEQALHTARLEVKKQREEEQKAVLDALGLAEKRAVKMTSEQERLREERDAIAEALSFVTEETKAMYLRNDIRNKEGEGSDEKDEKNTTSEAPELRVSRGTLYGHLESGGGSGADLTPQANLSDAIDDQTETRQMLEVPLDD